MKHRKTSQEEIDKIIDEATVDCYDEYEAFAGVVSYLSDEISFPFKAKWLGDVVEVIGIDSEESSCENEVMAQILTEEDEYTIALEELESMPDDAVNSKYLEMYEYWIRGFNPYEEG
jgi:energy-converting hydrogenase A subunit M